MNKMNANHTTTYFKAVRPDGSSFRDQSTIGPIHPDDDLED